MSNLENMKNELAALETKPAPDAQPEDEGAMQITHEERDSYRVGRTPGETLPQYVRTIRRINAVLKKLREESEKYAAAKDGNGEGRPA